jgi:hypothetical protein
MKKRFIILLLLSVSAFVYGQKKSVGAFAISIHGMPENNKIEDVKGYLYLKDSLIQEINIGDSIIDSNRHFRIILPENQYNVVIEGCYNYPIIYTDIFIRKKVMNFLIVDFEEFNKENITTPNILIIDYQKSVKRALQKFPIKFECTVKDIED